MVWMLQRVLVYLVIHFKVIHLPISFIPLQFSQNRVLTLGCCGETALSSSTQVACVRFGCEMGSLRGH